MKIKQWILIVLLLATWGISQDRLVGAGATFPYPLYSKMFAGYFEQTGVLVNYQSIGSGAGMRQLMNETVDFGATDIYMDNAKMVGLKAPVLHIPIVIGAVAVAYNLPGQKLNLSAAVVSQIYQKKILYWNDPQIKAINPHSHLPKQKIIVIHRSDASGTTAIFTEFLSLENSHWKQTAGAGQSVAWPTGLGAKGNDGVTALVKQLPGSIGYVELAYARQNNIQIAAIKNNANEYVLPSEQTIRLAAQDSVQEDLRTMLSARQSNGYPISGFTWILIYQEQNYRNRDYGKARELVKLLWWMINDGQKYAERLHYAPLPESVALQAQKLLLSVTFNGTPLLQADKE
jgi:phosphate transport system substrate-binding protein